MDRGLFRGCAVVAALTSVCLAGIAEGDLLAGWSFNGLSTPVGASIASDHGAGVLDLAAFGGTGLAWQAGTALNAWSGDVAGEGLGFTGTGANGKSAVFTVTTTGFGALSMSFAARPTGTGHMQSAIEAWNGVNWELVGGMALEASTWSLVTFDLSSMSFLNNGEASIRLRLEGASSSQGNLRLDNVQIAAQSIPAPGALLMAGTALLVSRRRRL